MCYDTISNKMLELLTELSQYINKMSGLNDALLKDDAVNSNTHFNQYISYFAIGRYYHFRCMGYMESLVMTKCYFISSLCYWKNMLVMPAYNNLMLAFKHLEELKSDADISANLIFKELINETEGLKRVAMEIMDTMKYYNLPC